jgi:hypothetical protein
MSKHTPGPWEIDRGWHLYERDRYYKIVAGWDYPHGFSLSAFMNEADACLIAAAPDLLEALKAVLAVADRKTVEFDMARAAIAKATNEIINNK